jgi:hypothetical protein
MSRIANLEKSKKLIEVIKRNHDLLRAMVALEEVRFSTSEILKQETEMKGSVKNLYEHLENK